MSDLYIFDLDGTIANAEHRVHLIRTQPPDYDAFYSACHADEPMKATIEVAHALYLASNEMWIFSGRSSAVELMTLHWLTRHQILHWFSKIKMRPEGDYTADDLLKKRWYDEMSDKDKSRLVLTFDDRDRMVKMWRSLGIPCFQVAEGAF